MSYKKNSERVDFFHFWAMYGKVSGLLICSMGRYSLNGINNLRLNFFMSLFLIRLDYYLMLKINLEVIINFY